MWPAPADSRAHAPVEARADAPVDARVLDASNRQALVSTRSLGRRGLGVALAEGRGALASFGAAPAFSSRWAGACSLLPSFEDDPQAYAAGVLQLVGTGRRPR